MLKGKWQVSFKIVIDGEKVDFEMLSPYAQQVIINKMISGYTQGDFIVDYDGDYNFNV
jgi:hypothetical protein